MNKYALILLCSAIGVTTLGGFRAMPKHDVHISYCKAEMTATTFKSRVTYYRDDFLKALTGWRGSIAGLTPAQLNGVMTDYVRGHFRLFVANRPLAWSSVGVGGDAKSLWFDLRLQSSTRLAGLVIEHTVLFKEYRDQMNLMSLKTSDDEHNYIFTPSKPSVSITL